MASGLVREKRKRIKRKREQIRTKLNGEKGQVRGFGNMMKKKI